MKKLFFYFLLLLFITNIILNNNNLKAQAFDFCQDYTSSGIPIGSYTSFDCNNYGGCYVYGLLNLPYTTNDDYIIYDVYKIVDGLEEYYYKYSFYTNGKSWSWCAMKMTFYSSGIYVVYIYTQHDLNSGPEYIGESQVIWYFY